MLYMNKFCTNCGASLSKEQNVCLNCGVIVNKNSDVVNDNSNKQANMGFIFGLVSIIAWIIPLFGFPVTICGIIFSIKGLSSENKTKAIIGLVLSIIFITITLINSIAGAVMGATGSY